MSGQVLSCPRCGAAESVPVPEEPEARACAYCGARFAPREPDGPPPLPPPSGSPAVALAGIFGLVVLTGLVALIVSHTAPRDPSSHDTSRAPARRVDPPPRATSGAAAEPAEVVSRTASTSVAAPPPPPPRPAATAAFTEHSRATVGDGSLWVFGVVTNTSPFLVGKPQVDVVLLDEEEREVAAKRGHAHVDALEAGESCPIAILVGKPPPHAALRFQAVVKEPSWTPEPAPGLEPRPLPPSEHTWGGWEHSGSVVNNGAQPAQFVMVQIAAYDEEDRLVGLAFCYAAGKEGIAPGASARYQTRSSIHARRPARFEVIVSGRVKRD